MLRRSCPWGPTVGWELVDSGRSGRAACGGDIVRHVADARYVYDRQDVHRVPADL
jgi:hypothetical protein